jgi:hypothetical protein
MHFRCSHTPICNSQLFLSCCYLLKKSIPKYFSKNPKQISKKNVFSMHFSHSYVHFIFFNYFYLVDVFLKNQIFKNMFLKHFHSFVNFSTSFWKIKIKSKNMCLLYWNFDKISFINRISQVIDLSNNHDLIILNHHPHQPFIN